MRAYCLCAAQLVRALRNSNELKAELAKIIMMLKTRADANFKAVRELFARFEKDHPTERLWAALVDKQPSLGA